MRNTIYRALTGKTEFFFLVECLIGMVPYPVEGARGCLRRSRRFDCVNSSMCDNTILQKYIFHTKHVSDET